ncbi:NAD-dependent epimerase/dehydratase family protein [Acidocella sp.]|uniref:NAD-dependent epimerase/dehydratase family protein n=1 Tax=Acidocella sp. TaxID=50710 RepID=UPI002618FFFE|nr:NAD-dependent epimerase/dehydratase family protein [Acidocella sp.]
MRLLVTGAGGFIGAAMLRAAREAMPNATLYAGLRAPAALPVDAKMLVLGDLASAKPALPPLDAVINAAGLGHRRGLSAALWTAQNVTAAAHLAMAARAAGAKRFVQISSAYVLGRAQPGPVTSTTPPAPADFYAHSKLAGEQAVRAAFGEGVIILRPAPVLGAGAKGNLPRLMRLIAQGVPLPFGALANQRSYVAVDDLAALALTLLAAPPPAAPVLAAHPTPLTPPELCRALGEGLGRPARLVPVAPILLKTTLRGLGKSAIWQSLGENFYIDPPDGPEGFLKLLENPANSASSAARYYVTTSKTP